MNNHWKVTLPLLSALLLASPEARSQIVPQATVAASGAICATNGTYRIDATLGQAAVGRIVRNAAIVDQGFWYALPRMTASTSAPAEPTAGTTLLSMHASPNPFSESTQLTLQIPSRGHVSLTLYDLLGRPVRTLLDGEQSEGTLTLSIPSNDLPSGRYTVLVKAGDETRTIALTVQK